MQKTKIVLIGLTIYVLIGIVFTVFKSKNDPNIVSHESSVTATRDWTEEEMREAVPMSFPQYSPMDDLTRLADYLLLWPLRIID